MKRTVVSTSDYEYLVIRELTLVIMLYTITPQDQESTTFSYPGCALVCITISGAKYCGVPTIVRNAVPSSTERRDTYISRYFATVWRDMHTHFG
jgi:hypothetical protein